MRSISNNFDSTPEDDSSNRWEYTPPSSGGGGQAGNVDYSLLGLFEVPEIKTYPLCVRSPITGTIIGLDYKLSAGSLTGSLKINNSYISGLDNFVASTGLSYVSGYTNNIFNIGDVITLEVIETSSATDFGFVVRI
jgi:hypothetical protein